MVAATTPVLDPAAVARAGSGTLLRHPTARSLEDGK